NQHGADDTDDGNASKHSKCPGWAESGTNHKAGCHRANDAAEAAKASTPSNTGSACGGIEVVRGQPIGQNLSAQHANASNDDGDVGQGDVAGKRQEHQ